MTDKILKLLNSQHEEDVLLGITLFVEIPDFLKYLPRKFETGNSESQVLWTVDNLVSYKDKFTTTGIIFDDFVIYRISNTLVYASINSSFYRSCIEHKGFLDNRNIKR